MTDKDDELDIIQVSYEDFLKVQESINLDEIDDKIKTKMQSLLQNYDCFTKDILFYAPPNKHEYARSGGGKKSFSRKYVNNPHGHGYHVVQEKVRTPAKEMHGILNKITASTYANLLQRIIRVCAYKSCSKEAIDAIMLKCYIHGSYSYLYHNILYELHQRYSEQVKEATISFIDRFLEELPKELENLHVQPNSSQCYEGYCMYMKRKTLLLSKMENVIIINKRYGNVRASDKLCSIIFNEMQLVADRYDLQLMDYFDIISCIVLILKNEKLIDKENMKTLIQKYNEIRRIFNTNLPKKTQFCWETIVR